MGFLNESGQNLEQGVIKFGNSLGKVTVGSNSKKELLEMMKKENIHFEGRGMNSFILGRGGRKKIEAVNLIKFKIGDLVSLLKGGSVSLGDIVDTAKANGLRLCPKEAALQFALKESERLKGPIGVLVENGDDFGYVDVDVDVDRIGGNLREITIRLLDEFGREGIDDLTEEIVMMK